ncbi:hypothetical protein [Mesorhizobium sp.]|uniref:hypothetical protein n=1 Tax=Mesorhizobium sp. TaxID=1871066 RepID=UPI002579842F|nr:hypothetical protein [Mesorhizobium sp.]
MMKHLAHAALVEVLSAHWTILEMIRRGWTGWAWSSPVQPAASLVVAIVIWTGAPIGAPTGLTYKTIRLGEHYEPCDKRIAALRSPSRRLNPRGFLDGRAIIAKPIDQFLGLVTAYARSHCQGLDGRSVRAGDLASFRKSIVCGKGSAASRSISALAWCQCRS